MPSACASRSASRAFSAACSCVVVSAPSPLLLLLLDECLWRWCARSLRRSMRRRFTRCSISSGASPRASNACARRQRSSSSSTARRCWCSRIAALTRCAGGGGCAVRRAPSGTMPPFSAAMRARRCSSTAGRTYDAFRCTYPLVPEPLAVASPIPLYIATTHDNKNKKKKKKRETRESVTRLLKR